eukprot:1196111-Prorocentrum_minimum.AAC.4
MCSAFTDISPACQSYTRFRTWPPPRRCRRAAASPSRPSQKDSRTQIRLPRKRNCGRLGRFRGSRTGCSSATLV